MKEEITMSFTSEPKPPKGVNSCSQEFIDFLLEHLIEKREKED